MVLNGGRLMFRLSKAAEYSIRGILHLSIHYSEDKLCDIEEIAGPVFLNYCLIYEGYCDRDKFCPVHDIWGGAQKVLVDYLSGCSFEQLAIDAREKQTAYSK